MAGPLAAAGGAEKEGGPSPAGGAGRGEAGAAYVRRAAGGMKGADSGPRPLPAPGARLRRAGQPGRSLGSQAGTTPDQGCQGAEPGRGPAGGGARGGDVATAQAGGARPRREAEPPGEEAQSGPGAAAGGSGNAGTCACSGERPARSAVRAAAGLVHGRGAAGRACCSRGAGSWGPGVAQSGPQLQALRPVSSPVWVPVPPLACPPRAQGGEVSGALPAGP